jgi:hypothetical protein
MSVSQRSSSIGETGLRVRVRGGAPHRTRRQRAVSAPTASATQQLLAPGLSARLSARAQRGRLDRALRDGADPAASPRLAARAAALASRRSRTELASGLERLVARAQGPHRRWWALEAPDAVLANSSQLHGLASLLHSDTPLYAHGLAHLRELLADGRSPLYRGDPTALSRALSDVSAALLR